MKQFISFQKNKALVAVTSDVVAKNEGLAHQFNHEIMKYGYILNKSAFDMVSALPEDMIQVIYNDVLQGIKEVVGNGGYELIYRNFPQSVMELTYREFAINAILHYWTAGRFRPEDAGYLQREFKMEPKNYKGIGVISETEFEAIFTDLLYSGASIAPLDKRFVNWFIDNGYGFNFSKITFKETLSYVGKRLFENGKITALPTKDATNVLRIWAAYSGGDEGLKENTRFKQPSNRARLILRNTLENAYNLEESFKIHREMWLRVLFYLNPLTKTNRKLYPNLYSYTKALRNSPKELRTFASRVEELLGNKDILVLDLLKTRPGVFARRLDHTVREFGIVALNKYLESKVKVSQLIDLYNHFTKRDKKQDRGAVLASGSKSEVVTYDALEPLPTKLVNNIKETLLARIKALKNAELSCKKIYIDRALYFRPLAVNNRASSISLDGKANGTVEMVPAGKTIRMYVGWEGRGVDLDLSGIILYNDGKVPAKIGWNGEHTKYSGAIVYSGDNTGHSDKNGEYIDINLAKMPKDVEWVVVDARIYGGWGNYSGRNFAGLKNARAGWMAVSHPQANNHWQPDTIEHSVVLASKTETAYLSAMHVPSGNIVYLDLAITGNIVSTAEDALKIKTYLETLVTIDNGSDVISWDKINQGHVLNILGQDVVTSKEEADLVFDENTTWERVAQYLNN